MKSFLKWLIGIPVLLGIMQYYFVGFLFLFESIARFLDSLHWFIYLAIWIIGGGTIFTFYLLLNVVVNRISIVILGAGKKFGLFWGILSFLYALMHVILFKTKVIQFS